MNLEPVTSHCCHQPNTLYTFCLQPLACFAGGAGWRCLRARQVEYYQSQQNDLKMKYTIFAHPIHPISEAVLMSLHTKILRGTTTFHTARPCPSSSLSWSCSSSGRKFVMLFWSLVVKIFRMATSATLKMALQLFNESLELSEVWRARCYVYVAIKICEYVTSSLVLTPLCQMILEFSFIWLWCAKWSSVNSLSNSSLLMIFIDFWWLLFYFLALVQKYKEIGNILCLIPLLSSCYLLCVNILQENKQINKNNRNQEVNINRSL